MTEVTENQSGSKNIIGETSVIAFLSLIGYLCAICFHMGFLGYFGIEPFLVEVSLSQILASIAIFIFILIPAVPIIALARHFIGKGTANTITVLAIFLSLLTLLLSAFSKQSHASIIAILITCGVLVLVCKLILPLVWGRNIKGWNNKVQEVERKFKEQARKNPKEENSVLSLFNYLRRFLDTVHVILLFSMIILISFSLILGSINAQLKNEFYVLSTNPERLVIYKDGDRFWTVVFNRTDNSFEADYRIYSSEDLSEKEITMKLQSIEGLKQPPILKEKYSKNY